MTELNTNLDIIPSGVPKSVRVAQYDHKSRNIIIALLNNKSTFNIPEGTRVQVRGTKPSGKGFSYDCGFTGNKVTVEIKDQMTAESGKVPCEIVLLNGDKILGSEVFNLIVEKSTFNPGTITSSDTFDSLVEDAVIKCANENLIELYVDSELNNESEAPVGNNVICNNFANAIKGNVSGTTITIDDISPIKHNLIVGVHGKNLMNVFKINTQNMGDIYISAVGEGYLEITDTENYNGNGHVHTSIKLRELCPQLRVGKTYTLSAISEGWNKCIYLNKSDYFWQFNSKLTITEEMLDSGVGFYGFAPYRGQAHGVCKISNIQIEESESVTAYTPYINPTTTTIINDEGETYVPNADGFIDGIIYTSPTFTLSTNNENVVVECDYIRDSNKVIEKLTNAIIALGGSV